MKNSNYIILASFFVVLSACNRSWTCTCQFSDGSSGGEAKFENMDKGAATEYCNNYASESINIGATCTLSED